MTCPRSFPACVLFAIACGCPGPSPSPSSCDTWYADADGDGFGDPDAPVEVCDGATPAPDLVSDTTDCDDNDDNVHPNAPERCAPAGIDDDCDGRVDDDDDDVEGRAEHWLDEDGDGHGDPDGTPLTSCQLPADRAVVADDCDDTNGTVFPGAPERCDGLPNDCDAPNGVEEGATVAGGDHFGALGDALAAAVEGDTIQVCGSHNGVFVSAVPVHLVGQGGRDAVTLSADDLGTVLTVPAESSVTGLTLTQGQSPNGGGLSLSSPGNVEVRDSRLLLNTGGSGGGVFVPMGSTASFPGTVIEANTADDGGGIYAASGAVLDLTDAEVDNNRAGVGGGIYGHDVTIIGGLITNNDAEDDSGSPNYLGGGGLTLLGASSITGTEVSNNASQGAGGGISVTGSLDLVDAWIHDNDAGYQGGGIHASDADLTLTGTSEIGPGNVGGVFGGGVYVYVGSMTGGVVQGNQSDWQSGGMYAGDAVIDGVEVRGNTALNVGGGIEIRGGIIRNCVVEDNVADWAGGIYGDSDSYAPILIEDTIVGGNTATGFVGGGLYLESGATFPVVLTRVTVVDNVARDGSGIYVDDELVTLTDGVILRNVATEADGGAIGIGSTFGGTSTPQIAVTTSDLGTGVDDNAPADVAFGDGGSMHGWGVDATFNCNATTCDAQP